MVAEFVDVYVGEDDVHGSRVFFMDERGDIIPIGRRYQDKNGEPFVRLQAHDIERV